MSSPAQTSSRQATPPSCAGGQDVEISRPRATSFRRSPERPRHAGVSAPESAGARAAAAAVVQRPVQGVPADPDAWLRVVARRRLSDAARRGGVAARAARQVALLAEEMAERRAEPDRRLRLMVVFAHPLIDGAARAQPMLQTVPGADGRAGGRAVPDDAQRHGPRREESVPSSGILRTTPGPGGCHASHGQDGADRRGRRGDRAGVARAMAREGAHIMGPGGSALLLSATPSGGPTPTWQASRPAARRSRSSRPSSRPSGPRRACASTACADRPCPGRAPSRRQAPAGPP